MQELVRANRLTKVPYSDKPLPQGGAIVFLSPAAFEAKFKFEYSESLFGDLSELSSYLNNRELLQHLKAQKDLPPVAAVVERLKNPLDSLVLCDMGSEVGHGLFAASDIPPNTVLFMYSGVIEDAKPFSAGDVYGYSWIQNVSKQKSVSSKSKGGMARFLQHLPGDPERHANYLKQGLRQHFGTLIEARGVNLDAYVQEIMQQSEDNELNNIKFADIQVRKDLATGNVAFAHVVINDVPTVICWTVYGIKKHEQAGFSYGSLYWQTADKKPRYFLKDGSLVSRSAYSYKNERNPATAAMIAHSSTCNPVQLYQQGISEFKACKFQEAIKTIEAALQGFCKNGEASIKVGNCYSTLASCYRELNQIDKAIDCCEKALPIYHLLDKEGLDKLVAKYHGCLEKNSPQPTDLYSLATALCSAKQYVLALYKLQFTLKLFETKGSTKEQLAYCHSALATCYRELNNISRAISHCETAVHLREEHYGKNHVLTKNTQTKLSDLMILHQAQTSSQNIPAVLRRTK